MVRGALPENPPKTLVYDALARGNRDFDQVPDDLQRLEALRFRAAGNVNLKDWRATLETRAWATFEVIEVLHQAEQRDWTSHGRRRRRLEEPSASSDDVSVARASSCPGTARRAGR
jgi:hypothetical protein